MKTFLAAFLLVVALTTVHADQKIADAQQSLKDQGFFYGQVNGEKNTETSDAIRRYQIRNGLSVTGELDDATAQAIRKTATAESQPAPVAQASRSAPSPAPVVPGNETEDRPAMDPPAAQSFPAPQPPSGRSPGGIYEGRPVEESNSLFAHTPYETAPPEVQRKVILDTQRTLAERGLFRYPVDGLFSPNLEFSLRAYQSRVGLRSSGRLDLETLAALELLPGSRKRTAVPLRHAPAAEPPVRGEWIRP